LPPTPAETDAFLADKAQGALNAFLTVDAEGAQCASQLAHILLLPA
jgi:hypothetical protein